MSHIVSTDVLPKNIFCSSDRLLICFCCGIPAAWTPSSGQTLGCDDLPIISNLTLIGSGWTKAVYRWELILARISWYEQCNLSTVMGNGLTPPAVNLQGWEVDT